MLAPHPGHGEDAGGACSGFRLPGWSAPRRRWGWRWVEWYLDALYCRRRSLVSRSAWPADRRSSVEAVRFQEDDSKYRLRANWKCPPLEKKLKNKLNVSVISTNIFQIYVIFLYKCLEIRTFCRSSTEEEMSRCNPQGYIGMTRFLKNRFKSILFLKIRFELLWLGDELQCAPSRGCTRVILRSCLTSL